jgi:putative transcriptional regulator
VGGRQVNIYSKNWKLAGEKTKEPFHYKGCGLDDVYLISGYDKDETPYGEGVRIRNIEKLHEAIGKFLISGRKVLSGKELRFLRMQMKLTQSNLARILGCDTQQVARYEKEENRVSGPADRLIRLLYTDRIGSKRIPIEKLLKELDEMDDQSSKDMVFAQVDSDWRKSAAC